MVNTRSSTKKQEEKQKEFQAEKEQQDPKQELPSFSKSNIEEQLTEKMKPIETKKLFNKTINLEVGSFSEKERVGKVDDFAQTKSIKSSHITTLRKSKASGSASSSILARKKKLELEAAEAKARIQLDLIDKKLAADLAQLEEEEEEYSSQSSVSQIQTNKEVEKWLERSQQELNAQPVPPTEKLTDKLLQPPASQAPAARHSAEDTVHLLATALKDMAAVSTTNGSNNGMLSRLCTPRDLPSFSGDPMEWLQFKQAYDESTEVCNFNSKENLWRLRKCLQGLAKDAVTALLIGATTPDIVMSTLELQFGNPDIIISRIVQSVNKLPLMSQEYHRDIVPFSIKVKNYVAAVTAIGQDEYLKGMNIVSLILSKLPTVLISKWVDYSFPLINEGSKSRLVILSEFLNEEAIKTSKTAVILSNNYSDTKRKQPDFNHRSQAVLVQNELSDDKCKFCRASKHDLPDCKLFKKSLRKDRWTYVKRHGLCYKCLVSRHNKETCPAPPCDKDNCGLAHHRLLHYTSNFNSNQQSSVNITEIIDTDASETRSEIITHINSKTCKVLLQTVPINIHGPNGIISVMALLDSGSTLSLISTELSARAGLRGTKQTMRVSGAWNNTELKCESEVVNFDVSNKDGQMFTLQARSVTELNLPAQNTSNVNLKHYNLTADIQSQLCEIRNEKPQLLIGQDHYHLLLPLQIIKGKPDEPYLSKTALGWSIHGCVTMPCDKYQQTALFITEEQHMENERTLQEIHEEVRRSFTIESMGVTCNPRQNSEDLKALEHLERTAKLIDGRWHVGLPWKDTNCKLTESYGNAISRLNGVERKMKRDYGYATRYADRINHLFENDYATEVTELTGTPKTWYLPHFGVDNPNKKKLRLVFDCASKSNGLCLNDYLYKGPDLLISLYGIMLRFRENKIGITGDLQDMFLRVKIIPEDQDAFRFLWNTYPEGSTIPEGPVKTYTMTSLIFGANCSPFIAQFIKNKNTERYESSMPAAASAICKQHYMDDYIDSFEDEKTAIQVVNQVAHIHKQGGFHLRNFTSNNETLINCLPKQSLGSTAIRFKIDQQDDGERTLGLVWFPKEDLLGFDVSFKRIPEEIISGLKKPTKREMLRVVMSIFDVYGFLSPITIRGKIIIQDTWKRGILWDDIITDDLYIKWIEFLQLLKRASTVRLPRYYKAAARASEMENAPNALNSSAPRPAAYTNLQLHVLCDASSQAVCAVAYWRWLDNNNRWQLAFISSKCKVAGTKQSTIPRLELESALLAAKLANVILNEHKMSTREIYYWSDSTTVLHWIYNNARTYKPFVAHRLGQIDELTQSNQWRYVPTKLNIADIATRDSCELAALENDWFHGPSFLYEDESMWPFNLQLLKPADEDLECVMTIHVEPGNLPSVPEPERFSSWLRLLRATCAMLLFINRCKKLTGQINCDVMDTAERLLIRYSQTRSFPEDLENLKNKRNLDRKSRLLTLTPVLDDHGILRVDGRINAALDILPETKQPVILDGRDYVTRLIVKHYHVTAAHGNQETVVNNLKQKYWVIRIRPTVKHISSKCMLCRIKKAMPQPPRMGDLPPARLAHHQRAFTFCGIDLFGPMEVTVLRRREKRYGVLFTCLTVRAIHIEIVTRLTSDALIMALRRMAARRGWPQHIFSDNGTNLKGADNELKKSINELDEDVLRGYALNYGTTWNFIPPASPHWGGAWERLIRSTKASLKVVLREHAPRDEVLSTLMAEVEQIVNSRPLTHVTVEPKSAESLTPNHFLLGGSSNLPILGAFDHSDMFLRKQWRTSQRLADLFWKRWVQEVLPQMIPRPKWHQDQRPLQVGDLVLVVDPESPRNVWPRGLIVETIPGKDGRIRVVHVKTKTGILRRSAARVAYIPTGDD